MRYRPPIVALVDPLRIAGRKVVPLPVGLIPWDGEHERTTVVVKTSYRYDRLAATPELVLMPEQPPFSQATPSRLSGASEQERSAPDDLVYAKPYADVMVVGHAFARGPLQTMRVSLAIPDVLSRSGEVASLQIAAEIPLTAAFVQPENGEQAQPWGPVVAREVNMADEARDAYGLTDDERREQYAAAMSAVSAGEWKPWEDAGVVAPVPPEPFAADTDTLLFNSPAETKQIKTWDDMYPTDSVLERGVQYAARCMTGPFIEPDARIEMRGLTPGGDAITLPLPGHDVIVLAEVGEVSYDVRMEIDTLLLDTEGMVSLTWRGQVPTDLFASSQVRLIAVLATVAKVPDVEIIYDELARAHYLRAQVPDSVETQPIVGRDVGLASARQMNFHRTPAPLLSLEQYAELAARIAAAPHERAQALADHDMDSAAWMLEERAWLKRVGQALERGDMSAVSMYNKTLAQQRRVQLEKQSQ